ncbi:tripartite tricarboxylate transporter substrate binding protein [Cupriavidus basilensis]
MISTKRWLAAAAAAAVAATAALTMPALTLAQAFPAKPVKIVVPYPPGGTNDIVVRLLAHKLGDSMGQPFVVENKPGASGNLGAEQVARAAPDGYTLLLVTTGHSIHPSLYKNLRYNIKTDLTPVSELTRGPMLVMVTPSLPYKTVRDVIAAAKAKPGSINFGSAGNGSSTHLATELLSSMAGVKMTHIPYSGSAPAMADVMAGNAQLVMDLMFSALPQVNGGKLRAIAITGAKRSPLLPNVPTVAESGVPGFETLAWNGLMAPANTPKPIIDKLNAEIHKALDAPEMKERLRARGFEPSPGTPEQFGALIRSEIDRWAKVVKSSGAKVE